VGKAARKIFGVLALSLFVTLLLPGYSAAQEAYRVVEIAVEGNRITTSSLILGVSSISKGSALTPGVIQQTIHRLYGLGIFKDVTLEVEEVAGGLKVYIIVSELPKLSGLTFSGNNKIKSKDLKEKIGLGVGGYISPYLTNLKKHTLLDLYAEKGYFQAKISTELTYNSDSTEASLTYKIDEKSKVKVAEVRMTGNKRVEAHDLIKKMRNRKRGFLKSSDFAQDKFGEDLQKIVEEYHKLGYVDAYVVSDSFHIDSVTNQMTIFLNMYEGPRYYFGEVTFNGAEIASTKLLKRLVKYKEGDVFNQDKYDESLFEIYSGYQEIGLLHARIDDQRSTRSDSIIDVSYDITEGLPSHVNLVKVLGNTKTKDQVIRREIKMLPGQTFNRALLIRSVRDIMALNFFTNVEPVPINLPNGDVDIEFRVEEKQTGQISAGAGYNSQDKVVGTLGMGIPNFRGTGQNLSFNVDFGSRRNSFSVSFTEPWLMGRPTLLGADLFKTNRRTFGDFTEGRQGGALRLGRRLRWPDNFTRFVTSYRLERTKFFDFDTLYIANNSFSTLSKFYYETLIPSEDDSTLLIPVPDSTFLRNVRDPFPGTPHSYGEKWNTASRWSISVTRDSRNLPQFATKGSILSYTFSNTGGPLQGLWDYRLHKFSVSKFVPLFWRFSLAAKIQYSAISTSNDDLILLSDRFTPGGTAFDGMVRGYDDGSLTPDSLIQFIDTTYFFSVSPDSIDRSDPSYVELADSKTDTSGVPFRVRVRGKYMLVSNIEIQFPIAPGSIYGLFFFDAGNSFLNASDIKPRFLYKSVGVGFRISVPGIGTIGFDFAKPLDNIRNQSNNWRPHFQIGSSIR